MNVEEQLRQDKVRSLLSGAALCNRRLQWDEALKKCQEALALDSQSAEAHELVGDILQARGNWDGALQSYKTAQALNPKRTVLEEKIGLVSIELDQIALREERREQLKADPSQLKWDERDPKVACILSAIVPGLGQIYNRDYVKAGVILGVSLVSLTIFVWAFHGALDTVSAQATLSRKLDALINYMQSWSIPKLLWMLLNSLLPVGLWGYSLIEAPLRAKQINREVRAELGVESTV
jgi:tetratricopeptide (TPR) repeat protein